MNKSWGDIREFYASNNSVSAKLMLPVVEQIQASRYIGGLFAWTSHLDLCITQIPIQHPYHGPFLRLAPDNVSSIEFRYIDTPIKSKQWSRKVAAADGFSQLEKFIQQLHWFPSPGCSNDS